MTKTKVWMITGTSSGFGRSLVEELLKRGERVVATLRKPEVLKDLVKQYPGRVLAVKLDVTKKPQIAAAVGKALATFKRIDVLVNNAGYGLMGSVEDVADASVKRIFDTNVFGLMHVTQAVLPVMRKQKSGHILNVSSVVGQMAFPMTGLYCATKHTVEGLSESLAAEVAGFGIKVTIIEPGYFRTDFGGRSIERTKPSKPYKQADKMTEERFKQMGASKKGDPRKGALAMMAAVDAAEPPLRLVLGQDAVGMIRDSMARYTKEIDRWETVSVNTRED
jgi:NAD(P)-dependent dehydrogenase (short-subunit alcohol dehydrogenase family)